MAPSAIRKWRFAPPQCAGRPRRARKRSGRTDFAPPRGAGRPRATRKRSNRTGARGNAGSLSESGPSPLSSAGLETNLNERSGRAKGSRR